jgi:hypothetical protein
MIENILLTYLLISQVGSMTLEFLRSLHFTIKHNIMGFLCRERSRKCWTLLAKNKGYLIMSWLMTLHSDGKKNILEILNNDKHKWSWFLMENLFGSLKETLSKLHEQTNMHIAIVPNIIIWYLLEIFVIDRHKKSWKKI